MDASGQAAWKFHLAWKSLAKFEAWLSSLEVLHESELMVLLHKRAPCGDRTYDHTLTKRMLYQLS